MDKLKDFLNQKTQLKILDVGTGAGNFVALIREFYKDYSEIVGIDTSEMAITTANKNFQDDEKITFQLMNALKMDFEDNTFDLVCLSNSLHHLIDVKAILVEMERVCKPEGFILISEMIKNDLDERQMSHLMLHHFSAEIDRLHGDTHNDTLTDQEILDILAKQSTFKISDSWKLEREPAPETTEEEKEWFYKIIDRIITKVVDPMKKNEFIEKGNQIKEYINHHGYDGCTTLIVLLTQA